MPQSTCPSCNRKLWIGDSVKASVLTCPACLAKIENPQTETSISSEPLVHREMVATPTAERCPACGKRVAKEWHFCPSCGGRHGGGSGLLDDEVRRDRRATSSILAVLAVCGGFGICAYFLIGIKGLVGGVWWLLPAGILVLLFLFLIAGVIMFHRTREDPSRRGLERLLVGTLALTGGLIVLLCLLLGALYVFLIILCWEPRPEPRPRGQPRFGSIMQIQQSAFGESAEDSLTGRARLVFLA
jgi:hypothetical protein